MDTQIFELSRPNKSVAWGFSIQGGKEFGCPLSVLRVTSGSIADQLGLVVGDLLLKINLLPTDQMTHQQAITQIQKLEVILETRKSKPVTDLPPPPPLIDDNVNNSFRMNNSMGDLPLPPPEFQLSKQSISNPPTLSLYPPPPLPFLNEIQAKGVQKSLPFRTEIQTSGGQKPLPFLKELHKTTEQKQQDVSMPINKFDNSKIKSTYNPLIIPDSKKFEETISGVRNNSENNKYKVVAPTSVNFKLVDDKVAVPSKTINYPEDNKTNNVPSVILDNKKVELLQQRMPAENNKHTASSSSLGKFIQNQTNNPDRDAKDLIIQQINLDKNAAICFVCKDHIKGSFVEAKNKRYCPNHFSCSVCGQTIKGQFIESTDGILYCVDDYKNHVAPKCNKCNSPIVENQIKALDKTWHANCFVCEVCKKPISNGRFHLVETENGEMTVCCETDYKEHYEIKCSECDVAIENDEKYLLMNGKHIHVRCFKR